MLALKSAHDLDFRTRHQFSIWKLRIQCAVRHVGHHSPNIHRLFRNTIPHCYNLSATTHKIDAAWFLDRLV